MTYSAIQSQVFNVDNICWAVWVWTCDLTPIRRALVCVTHVGISQLYSCKPFGRAMEFNIVPVCLSMLKPQIFVWNTNLSKLKYTLSPWGGRPYFIPNVVCSCKCEGRKLLTCTLNESIYLSAMANLAYVSNPRQF